jgi:hypothetical protein
MRDSLLDFLLKDSFGEADVFGLEGIWKLPFNRERFGTQYLLESSYALNL